MLKNLFQKELLNGNMLALKYLAKCVLCAHKIVELMFCYGVFVGTASGSQRRLSDFHLLWDHRVGFGT